MMQIRLTGRWLLMASLILIVACTSGDRPTLLGPEFAISDAAHSGGTPGFFFLPPMVPQPVVTGVFDSDIATVNPAVAICDVTDGPDVDCGGATPALRAFTVTSTPAIALDGEKYKVDWDTKEGDFTAGRTYRVHVLAGTGVNRRALGFADILLTTEPGKVKNLANDETIVLNDGRTLPIHFRIEQGVVVPPGPARVFALTGLPTSLVAGASASVTVTARDEHGQVATGYRGTVTFTSSDPEASLPANYTFTDADAGSHTFADAVSFETAGTVTLRVSDVNDATLFGEVTLTVEPTAAATLELTGLVDAVAGTEQTLTVAARDPFGNVATGYAGTIAFSSSDPLATLPDAYTFTAADAGTRAFSGVTLRTAGSVTVTATDNAVATVTGSQTVTIEPAAAATLVVSGLTDGATAGTVLTLTVTARDASGNVATDYTGTIAFTSTDPQATLPDNYTFTASDAGTHEFPASVTLRTAGSVTVTATDQAVATITGFQTVTVSAAGAASLVLSGIPDPATAGVAYDLTVTVRDEFANIATGYAGTLQFSSSDLAPTLPPPYMFQASDAGVRTFAAGVTFRTAGLQSLQAADAAVPAIASSVSFNVDPAAAAELRFTTQPTEAPEETPIAPPVVVTAFDQFGNTATSFSGQVAVTIGTNPASGVLSGILQQAAALGVATFNDLSIDAAGNGYTLVASATGLTGATSDPFTITAVQPTEVHWINPAGGLWSGAANWSTGVVPAPEQAVLIDLAGTYTVTLDVNATVNSLTLGAASGVQTLSASSNRILAVSTSGTILTAGRLTLNSAVLNGPGAVTNAGVVRLINGDIASPFTNQGTLISEGTGSSITGTLSTQAGSLLRLLGTSNLSSGWALLTVASGFTNQGAIELAVSHSGALITLTVSSGTLVNAPGATISLPAGAGPGVRTLAAQLDNQGTLDVGAPLTLNRVSADHLNSGLITLTGGNLTVSQSGTTPSFTNTGTITVPAGRTLSVSTGSFTQGTGATLDGGGAMSLVGVNPAVFGSAFSLSALSLFSTTASFATDISTETLALSLNGVVVNGPGTLTNAAGKTLTVDAGQINTALVNAGTLVSLRGSSVNGAFTTHVGSLLRLLGTSNLSSGWALLTVASGFTNQGAIELAVSHSGALVTLTVSSGTLVNAPGATISLPAGAGPGVRTLAAQLDNQGTLDVGAPLTLNRVSADHLNSGLVTLTGGNLTVRQSGTGPSFTNSGTVTVSAGRTWTLSGTSSFTQGAGATLDGSGAMSLVGVNPAVFGTAFTLSALSLFNTTASFASNISTETLALSLNGAVVNGPVTLTNAAGKSLTLDRSDINVPLVNAGTLVILSGSSVNGAFTTGAGSLLRVQGYFDGLFNTSSALTVAGGFTNHGVIELTNSAFNTHAGLTVSNGTLVNAAGATISSLAGVGSGTRTLTAQLDNQGTLTVAYLLTINRGSADHLNSGLVALTGGNLTVSQSGTTPSFTNTGTVTVPAGRTWTLSGTGSFAHQAGATLDGGGAMSLTGVNPAAFGTAFSLSALTLINTTANFATDITTETLALSLFNATINGPGTLTNAAGKSLTLNRSDINAPLVNAGTLVSLASSSVNGAFSTGAGSVLRVQGFVDGIFGNTSSALTVAGGFTNNGAIELTSSAVNTNATLTVSSGTLVSAAGGTIRALVGAGGGTRTLTAQLDNQGTLTVAYPLTINRSSADHANSGTITLSAGDLTISQSGTSPTLTNTGVIDLVGPGAVRLSGGTFANQAGGTIQGAGTFESGTTTAFSNAGSVTATLVRVGDGLSGAGTFAPVTAEFFGSATSIPAAANYSYTHVRVLSSAAFSGSTSMTGNLTVAGSGNLTIGGHEIVVGGNFATQSTSLLTMQNAAGVLAVTGGATFDGGSTNTRLTAGTLRVGGNFAQAGGSAAAFAASVGHVTVLNGTGAQSVAFANPGASTTTSHFQRLEIANTSAGGVVLNGAVFANGQLRTPTGLDVARLISGAGFLLTAGGLDAYGLVLDAIPLRVVNGEAITRFDNATFRNIDAGVTQFRLDRLNDVVTFNSITFETEPTTGVYLHLVDTDLPATIFTVMMQSTAPANHGGKVIESVPGQLLGWPL